MGLKDGIDDLKTPIPLDAINPVYPLETLTGIMGGFGLAKAAVRKNAPAAAKQITKVKESSAALATKMRNTDWIENTPIGQFQSKFKHAQIFGIKGNANKQNLEAYKKAVEQHIKSANTIVKKGTYHKKTVTHYYNEKTGINVIRDNNGQFKSAWKLTKLQKEHIKNGNLGGGSK